MPKWVQIYAYEAELTEYLYKKLQQIPSIRIYGPQPEVAALGRVAIVTFSAGDVPAQELSTRLDRAGVAISAGFHEAQPLHNYLGIQSTARVSLYFYNTHSEVDAFIAALKEAIDVK